MAFAILKAPEITHLGDLDDQPLGLHASDALMATDPIETATT